MKKELRDYNYIAFDLDGTLINTYEGVSNALQYVMKHFGRRELTQQEARLCIGPPLEDSYINLFGFTPEEARIGLAKFREFYGPIGQNQCKPYDGIEEVLAALQQNGKKLFVATSKLITPALSILERFGLDKYFLHIEGSPPGEGDFRKSDILNAAFRHLDIKDKSDVILIGDTKYDIIGAKEAGIASMGILYGFGSKEDFIANGADYIVDGVDDILKSFV